MHEAVAAALRDDVHTRLDYLDRLVAEADLASRAALADTEITRLTQAWRALLTQHQPDRHGRCRRCSRWRRPHPHPCPVWTIAYQHLLVADTPPRPGPADPPPHSPAGGLPGAPRPAGNTPRNPRHDAFPATPRPRDQRA